MRALLNKILRKYGYHFTRYSPRNDYMLRRRLLFEDFRVDLVLDVGASDGGYGRAIRQNGYRKRIMSFEPRMDAFKQLKVISDRDPEWDAMNLAVGDNNGTVTINIAANGDSSSIRELALGSANSAAGLQYVAHEKAEQKTIDALYRSFCAGYQSILLKIDTQGYEFAVLDGARASLPFIDSLQVEMSLTPAYKGQARIDEMCARLQSMGYVLVSLEPGFHEESTGRLFEVDGIFHRYRG